MTHPNVAMAWDDTQLVRRLVRTENQAKYGVRDSLNSAGKRLQGALHDHVRASVRVREKKQRFFFGTQSQPGGAAARITQFATFKDRRTGGERMFVELALIDTSKTRTTLLPGFETGATRRPFTPGAKHVAAPLSGRPARPSFAGPVPPQFTFAGLGFKGYRRGKRLKKKRRGRGAVPETVFGEFGRLQRSQLTLGGVQWKGKQRTFILLHSKLAPEGGVFQRFGKGRGDIRMIYAFLKPFPLERRLHWVNTAQSLGPRFLHDAVEDAMIDVVQHNAGEGMSRGLRKIEVSAGLITMLLRHGWKETKPTVRVPDDLEIEDVAFTRRPTGHMAIVFVSSGAFNDLADLKAMAGGIVVPLWVIKFDRSGT